MSKWFAPFVVLAVTGLGSCSGSADDAAPRPTTTTTVPAEPGADRLASRVVPLPDDVEGARFPWWSADGERLLFSATPAGSSRVEIMSVAPDGSDLACITCGVEADLTEPLLKPMAFGDGRRIAIRVGNQNPTKAADHAIVECTPSVASCDEVELVPLVPPAADDPAVQQDQRELRLSPDGLHVGISQVRTSATGTSDLIAIVARLTRTDTAYELDDPRVVSERGELKSFTPDGRRVLVAEFTPGPFELANPDVVSIDLATGHEERVTYAPDYDEPVEYSPDGESYVVGSGRGSGLFETVSQVHRPSLLGRALDPLTAALFAGYRPQLLEGWIVRSGAEADGDLGTRIPVPDGDFDARPIWNWSPDGTAITFWEGSGSGFETDPGESRLVVTELVDREPVDALEPIGADEIDPTWAPALAGYVPDGVPTPQSRDGKTSGTVTVEVVDTADQLTVSLTYDGFSDDGEWVIDGTERAERRGGTTTYTADLTLTGDHEGFLRADAVISVGGIEGTITSSVDGHELTLPPAGGADGGS
ncbi:MAG: hypothetical protein KF906_03720 [Actinobacteria bacterium]|nr:hypothetical protein [Actinomycetota bacterium]